MPHHDLQENMTLQPVPGVDADDLENFWTDIVQTLNNAAPKVAQRARGILLRPAAGAFFPVQQLEDVKDVLRECAEQFDVQMDKIRLVLRTSEQLRANRAARAIDEAHGVPGRYWRPRPVIDSKPAMSKPVRGKRPRGELQELVYECVRKLAPDGARIEVAKVLDRAMTGFVPDDANRSKSKANRRVALRKALQGLAGAGLLSLFDDASMVSTFAGAVLPDDEFREID